MVETFCHLNLSISTVLDYQNKIKRQRIRNHVYTICTVPSYIYFPFVSYFYYCICIWIYYIYYIFFLLLLIKVLSKPLELLHFFKLHLQTDLTDWPALRYLLIKLCTATISGYYSSKIVFVMWTIIIQI